MIPFKPSPRFERLLESFQDPKGISKGTIDYVVSAGIPIIYGALHFLGWHAQFPTTTERLLWRVAAVGVASPGAGLFVLVFLVVVVSGVASLRSSKWEADIYSSGESLTYQVILFFYMLCSIYLYVESIRQLWYLAPEAYVVASWSYYFLPSFLMHEELRRVFFSCVFVAVTGTAVFECMCCFLPGRI